MIYMTLNEIAEHAPCSPSWNRALALLDKTEADDTKVSLLDVLENLSIQEAIWCFRVNWFKHKPLYMQFINNCASRASEYVAAITANSVANSAATAAAAAYVAYVANSAAITAYAATAAANAADYAAAAATAAATACSYAVAASLAATAAAKPIERQLQYDDLKRLLIES